MGKREKATKKSNNEKGQKKGRQPVVEKKAQKNENGNNEKAVDKAVAVEKGDVNDAGGQIEKESKLTRISAPSHSEVISASGVLSSGTGSTKTKASTSTTGFRSSLASDVTSASNVREWLATSTSTMSVTSNTDVSPSISDVTPSSASNVSRNRHISRKKGKGRSKSRSRLQGKKVHRYGSKSRSKSRSQSGSMRERRRSRYRSKNRSRSRSKSGHRRRESQPKGGKSEKTKENKNAEGVSERKTVSKKPVNTSPKKPTRTTSKSRKSKSLMKKTEASDVTSNLSNLYPTFGRIDDHVSSTVTVVDKATHRSGSGVQALTGTNLLNSAAAFVTGSIIPNHTRATSALESESDVTDNRLTGTCAFLSGESDTGKIRNC